MNAEKRLRSTLLRNAVKANVFCLRFNRFLVKYENFCKFNSMQHFSIFGLGTTMTSTTTNNKKRIDTCVVKNNGIQLNSYRTVVAHST